MSVSSWVRNNCRFAQGHDLVLYHGTKGDYPGDAFSVSNNLYGLYLTTDKGVAALYGDVRAYVLSRGAKVLDLSDGYTLWEFMKAQGILDEEDLENPDLERYITDGQIFQYDLSSRTNLADSVIMAAESLGYDIVKLADDLGGRGDNVAFVVINKGVLTHLPESRMPL